MTLPSLPDVIEEFSSVIRPVFVSEVPRKVGPRVGLSPDIFKFRGVLVQHKHASMAMNEFSIGVVSTILAAQANGGQLGNLLQRTPRAGWLPAPGQLFSYTPFLHHAAIGDSPCLFLPMLTVRTRTHLSMPLSTRFHVAPSANATSRRLNPAQLLASSS